ncbi:MAG: hypothetical protein WCS42_28180, partial [Verrucomicrobiota bacterium]
MNAVAQTSWRRWAHEIGLCCCFFLLTLPVCAELVASSKTGQPMTISQLYQISRQQPTSDIPVKIEGVVCWVSPMADLIILKDEAGVAPLIIEPSLSGIKPGQKVSVVGNLAENRHGASLQIETNILIVDIPHGMNEKQITIRLDKGIHPIKVTCFDGNSLLSGLGVFYKSPNLFRQRIPSEALFRQGKKTGVSQKGFTPGLDYRVFEGDWKHLPDFESLAEVKSGVIENFDPSVRTRSGNFGIEYTGFVELPADDDYTFYITPFASELITLRQAAVAIIGQSDIPSPHRLFPGQPLASQAESIWAQLEGTVIFCSREESGALHLQLRSGTGEINHAPTNACPGNAFDTGSALLGFTIQRRCAPATSMDRGLKHARYFVLKEA